MHAFLRTLAGALASALLAAPAFAQAPFLTAVPSARAGGDTSWGHALDDASNLYAIGAGDSASVDKRNASGTLQWRVEFGDSGTSPYGIALDGLGGIAVIGSFQGNTDFDPGPGTTSLDAGQGSVFVARFLEGGALDWVRQFHGGNHHGQAVAADASGAVFATSDGSGLRDMDPGPGVAELQQLGTWLVKLDIDGQYVWARTLQAFPYSLEVHRASGAIHWVGDLTGAIDLDPGPGVSTAAHVGDADAFVVKLDSAGQFLWGRVIGSPGLDEGVGLGVGLDGRVAIAGYGASPMDLDPGPGISSASGTSFLCVLDANGDFLWGQRQAPAGNSWWFDVGFDPAGNLYATGFLFGSVDADPGPGVENITSGAFNDAYLASYDSGGGYRWAAVLGQTPGNESGQNLHANSERVVATTVLAGSLDADPGAGVATVTAVDGSDGLAWIFAAGSQTPADKVYVADFGSGELVSLAPDGSDRRVLLTGLGSPTGLAWDGAAQDLYFTESTSNQIRRVEPDGSGLVTLLTASSRPYGVAVDAASGKLYWSEDTGAAIWRANLDGSGAQQVLGAPHVVGPTGIALDVANARIYWADYHGGFIGRANLDGSSPVILASGRGAPNHVALDLADGRLYWTEGFGESNLLLLRANLDGSAITPVDLLVNTPTGIGIDTLADELYVASELGSRVGKVRLDGSLSQSLWASFARPIGVLHVAAGQAPPTVSPTVRLTDSGGQGLAGGVVSYYQGGWHPFGTTGADGRVAQALPPGNYTFRIEYAGASLQKAQNTAGNPLVEFQTRAVSVQLRDSTGLPLDTGVAHYYAGGWRSFGTTSGGVVQRELLPVSYTFRIEYAGSTVQKVQNVATDANVQFATVDVSVRLRDSLGAALDTGVVRYYAGGWRSFGSTSGGVVHRELLPVSYTFELTYAGASSQQAQNVASNAEVQFQTRRVSVRLQDSQGTPLDPASVSYYAGGWRPFGNTSGGEASLELLGLSYTFRIDYAGASQQKVQNVANDPLVVFATRRVVVRLLDHLGAPLDTGRASYYAGSWRSIGDTSGGEVAIELLPLSYTFSMAYAGGSTQKVQNIANDATVVFQTGAVVSASATCNGYYAGGWRSFSQGMQLLPGSYTFRFSSGSPAQQVFALTAGVENAIR